MAMNRKSNINKNIYKENSYQMLASAEEDIKAIRKGKKDVKDLDKIIAMLKRVQILEEEK